MQETQLRSLGREDPLETGMATHSSILAWRIPWTGEPGGLQSMGSPRVRHDWVINTFIFSTESMSSALPVVLPIHHPRNLDSSVTRKENHSNGEFDSTKVFLVCPHISTLSPAWRKPVRMRPNWTPSYSQHRYQHVPRTMYHKEGIPYWCTEHNTLSKVFIKFVTILLLVYVLFFWLWGI